MVLVLVWHQKQECSIYKIPLNFLLSLERKPGIIHTNGADIFARFRKSGKKIMPRTEGNTFFPKNFHRVRWTVPLNSYRDSSHRN